MITMNLKEFFHEELKTVIKEEGYTLEAEIEFYLVNLLSEFSIRSEDTVESELMDKPLALVLKQAYEASPDERVRVLKTLGDRSLHTSGCFQDHFSNHTDFKYFMSMGVLAYAQLFELIRHKSGGRDFAKVYRKLSENFAGIVGLLSLLSERLHPPVNNEDILNTYDKWLQNQNSPRLRNRLQRSGITPLGSRNPQ